MIHLVKIYGQVELEMLPDGRNMRLLSRFSILEFPQKSYGAIGWYAEKGLITDGASIPQFMWGIIGSPFTGEYREPAIMHDAYYKSATRPRRQVDGMLKSAMRCMGVPTWKVYAIWFAVRLFGRPHFGKKIASKNN